MRYYEPRFRMAVLAGEQDRLISKIGGLPWGMPVDLWPHCCGCPQKLLAQLCHEPPMLDLGKEGLVLHLFQCLECGGIEDCGRDVVVINQSSMTDGLTRVPGWDHSCGLGEPPLIGEFWIDEWLEKDDGIPYERLPEFFVESSYWALQDEFSEIDFYDFLGRTRFGGSPRWTGNGPLVVPPPPFEFLFQIDNSLILEGVPPDENTMGCVMTTFEAGSSHQSNALPVATKLGAPWSLMHEVGSDNYSAEFTNLGSDGTIFVYIDRTQTPYAVQWLWYR